MVTQIDPISTPPTPADPPEVFEDRASQVWGDLFNAVPQMNAQAQEIEAIGQAAVGAGQSAQADSDAALGYRNEARAARDAALGYQTGASGYSAAAGIARAGAESAAGDADAAAGRAEAAAAGAESTLANAVQRTAATGAAILPEGTDSQRPATGSIPAGSLIIRGNTQAPADYKAEFWDRAAAVWKVIADRTWVGQQIATAVQAVKDWVDQQIGFAIIYPNGGTAASPASVAANSRYVSGNPFPNSHVLCEVEVLYGGVWQSPGFSGSGYQQFLSHGTQASMYGAGEIIVQTGINSVIGYSALTGGSGGVGAGVFATSAPCRVKVWKSKGSI